MKAKSAGIVRVVGLRNGNLLYKIEGGGSEELYEISGAETVVRDGQSVKAGQELSEPCETAVEAEPAGAFKPPKGVRMVPNK